MSSTGNRWAHITNVTLEDLGEISLATSPRRLITFEAQAPATPEIIDAVMGWARNPNGKLPIYSEEWMCLYCGSPQPLPLTHCEKCGAPRNWLIG